MKKMSLAGWVIVSGLSGILAGLFFGEYTQVLQPIGSIYVMLLQSVVYPYIICSLLHGLGQLSPRTAAKLFRASWPFYLAAWSIVYGAILLLDTAIPPAPSPAVLDVASDLTHKGSLLNVIIPANFFSDIATNNVPAVVVFAILFGLAIQQIQPKDAFMAILENVRQASLTIWNWVVKLAPVAVFAMIAVTAGTVQPDQAQDLLLYLALFMGGALFLSLVVFPLALSIFAPLTYRQVLSELKNGFIMAAVTTLSVAALPFILEAAQRIGQACGIEKDQNDNIASTSLAVSYPLGQLGNYFVYLFILFALFYFRIHLPGSDRLLLIPMTLLSCIGAPSSTVNAVTFLNDWLGLPDTAGILYTETMAITRYGQVLLSVAGFSFLTLLGTLNYFGKLQFNWRRAICFAVTTIVFFAVFIMAINTLGSHRHHGDHDTFAQLQLDRSLTTGVEVTEEGANTPLENDHPLGNTLTRIRASGTLRVGYSTMIPPFCYRNQNNELVGFDIAFAYSLARALGTRLTFVPADLANMLAELNQRKYDILMSGIALENERLQHVTYSDIYFSNPIVLVTAKANIVTDLSLADLRQRSDLRLIAIEESVLWDWTHALFPQATIESIDRFDELTTHPKNDGMLWAWHQAAVWANQHPNFTAIRPKGMTGILAYGWLMPPNSDTLCNFVNEWLALKKLDGFYERQRKIWFEGQSMHPPRPRWSILNHLNQHWVTGPPTGNHTAHRAKSASTP